MAKKLQHVEGRNAGHVMFYGLSTCGWCARTKKLLDEIGVDYYFQYVDQLPEEDREKALEEVRQWNPKGSFPTLVIDDKKCIVGYQEEEIQEALKS